MYMMYFLLIFLVLCVMILYHKDMYNGREVMSSFKRPRHSEKTTISGTMHYLLLSSMAIKNYIAKRRHMIQWRI
jgi:hypothetical protein